MSVILTTNPPRPFEPGVDRWYFRKIWAHPDQEFIWQTEFDENHLDEPWHLKITFHEDIYGWYFPKALIVSPDPPPSSMKREWRGKWPTIPSGRDSYWVYMLQPELPSVDWLPCRQYYAPLSCSFEEMLAYLKEDQHKLIRPGFL